MAKHQFNVRLDSLTLERIEALQAELGISQADIIRLAVRALAKEELKNPPKKPLPRE
jgi:antitoxin component of RelBE/YafQ-DinJ toxin-antitoxin module